jgi:hypothetical protein
MGCNHVFGNAILSCEANEPLLVDTSGQTIGSTDPTATYPTQYTSTFASYYNQYTMSLDENFNYPTATF